MISKIFSPNTIRRALEQFGAVSIKALLFYAMIGILIEVLIVGSCRLFGHRVRLSNVIAGVVLSIYSSIMLQLTLICRESGSRIGIEMDIFHGLVGPENDFHWLMLAYVVLNFMFFIPYGFTLSLFSVVNEKKLWVQCVLVLLLSFGTSMLIETVQLVTQRGYYETQDMVFNTLGGIAGWVVFQIIYRLGEKIMKRREA